MTDISIRVDAKEAIGLMGRISDNYATARTWALNRTAEDVTAALRREASGRFMFRGRQGQQVLNWYAPRTLPNVMRANNSKPWATVEPEGPGKILRPFETGTPKTGLHGQPVAIPTRAVRPTPEASIPKKLFPFNLFPQLRHGGTVARTKSGKIKRSKSFREVKPFLLDPASMVGLRPEAWGIYRRVGPGRGDIQRLWSFRPSARRPKLLDTYNTARRVVAERWAINMAGAFDAIVRSKSGKASLLDLLVR
jgi:hypothetical protein